jgi:hypothetical protein
MSNRKRPQGSEREQRDREQERLYEECEEALEEVLRERLEPGAPFRDYEQTLLEIAHEVVRRKLEKKLERIESGFADRLAIDHTNDWHGIREGTVYTYRRHSPGSATYHSTVGPLNVKRATYRESHRNGATYVPLELEAGLIERMTPAMAKSLAISYAHMPLRACEEMMRASGLQPPSRSTLDRAARDLGAYAVACNDEIEPVVRANEILDTRARSLAIGFDRTAVPMRQGEEGEGISACTRDLRRSRPRPKAQAAIKGAVQWRMDYVGTVSLLDEGGERLTTRKYRLPGEADASLLLERMMADVRRALEQRPQLSVTVVQDGAPELWHALAKALKDEPLVTSWQEVLDWYHLDERLTKCLELCIEPKHRRSQRRRWHTQLLESDTGMTRVLRSLRSHRKTMAPEAAEDLSKHIDYFSRNRRRTAYASCRRENRPIGSGITEGACKSLVAVRAKRSGQRWSQRGLSSALHLRAICDSDRFDRFWPFFAARYQARHIVALGQHWS